jgi:hypothetical protein
MAKLASQNMNLRILLTAIEVCQAAGMIGRVQR